MMMSVLANLPPLARIATVLLGLACTGIGVRCILQPIPFAETFGLPFAPVSRPPPPIQSDDSPAQITKTLDPDDSPSSPNLDPPPTNPFIPVVGVRNIAAGLSLLAFSTSKDPRPVGILLLCNLASMFGDTLICYRFHRGATGGVRTHFVAALVFAALGSYMALQ